jgi:hypothetical protein
MSTERKSARRVAPVAEFCWLAAALWFVFGYIWPTLSPVEVPALQAMLDPRLFQHDFVVREYLRFNPRFYYNLLIYLPAAAGVPLPWVCALWQLIAVGVLVTGLRAIAKALGIGVIGAAILVVWALQVETGDLGLTYLYIPSPAPGLWAAAIAVWGGALAVQQRWRAAYVCFGAAALLQFLVGFYAGLLLLPALWRDRGLRALPQEVIGWVIGLAAVYLPMKLGGITGGAELGNAAFVEIYAQLRHPHHMVPTAWSLAAWMQAVIFYGGAVACCVRLGPPSVPRLRWLLGGILFTAAAMLVINYFGVEVWPSAFIAKLQAARTTPLAELATLAALALTLQNRLAQRDYAGAGLLALAPFSAYPGFLLLLAAILLTGTAPRWTWQHTLLAVATCCAFYETNGITVSHVHFYARCLIAFFVLCAPAWLARRPGRMAWVGAVALSGALGCAAFSTTSFWPPWLAERFAIDAAPFDIPGILGEHFRKYAPVDAVVLVPPDGDVWAFKLYARRAMVVDIKHFPFTDRGIAEWQRRMGDVLGTPFVRGLDVDAAWAAQPPGRIAAIAARYGARYVLTRDRWHPQLPGRRIDRLQDWSVWELPESR